MALLGEGAGLALCWLSVLLSRQVLWVVCVRVGRVSRPLAGRGIEVGDCFLGLLVEWPFVGGGRLLVGGARRQGCGLGGVRWLWGIPC